MCLKTRVVTSVVGLGVLALVLCFFDTLVFNAALAAVALIALHEIYSAFSLKCPAVYAGLVPITLLIFLYGENAVHRHLFWAALYATVLFLAACTVLFFHALDYAKLAGTAVFFAVVLACFYSMLHLRACFPRPSDAVYFILLGLGFAWGGDTCAYFAGRAFGRHKLAPVVSPHKTVEGQQCYRRKILSSFGAGGRRGQHAGHFGRFVCLCGEAPVRHQRLWNHFPRARRHSGSF